MMNNLNANAAHLRDTFLEAEKEYVKELLKIDDIKQLVIECNKYQSDVLFKMAQEIVEKVEAGEIPDNEMGRVEIKLTILLAAIRDKILLKELVLTPDGPEVETSMARSR